MQRDAAAATVTIGGDSGDGGAFDDGVAAGDLAIWHYSAARRVLVRGVQVCVCERVRGCARACEPYRRRRWWQCDLVRRAVRARVPILFQ